MSDLNEAQKKAVEKTDGPILVLAGAGAGKTRVITYRIKRLIEKGINPSNILAITFTNKAAKEMRGRVEEMLSVDPSLNRPVSVFERPFISTFHSLGVHILREHGRILGLSKYFSIFDRGDSLSAIREATKESGLDPKQYEPQRFLSLISREKGEGVTLEEFKEKEHRNGFSFALISIWEKYEKKLSEEKALDFDDLLLKTFTLLRKEEVRTYYQNVWKYIHIDEYQDTNRVQYEIVKLLTGEEKNICAVGDIDQSIYSWRGADFKNIMRFEKDFPETETILLEENYRSTKTIIQAANDIIAKNTLRKDKTLFTKNEDGEKILIYNAGNESDEARFVAETAIELIDSGVPPREIAVLYRANFQSRILEEMCLSYKVPYQVLGTRFFERAEVKDIVSYIRASLSEESSTDFRRIINTPPRGIGKVSLLKILSGEKNKLPEATRLKLQSFENLLTQIKEVALSKPLSETIVFTMRKSGLETYLKEKVDGDERLENLYELVTLATKYDKMPGEKAVADFLADAALASDQDEMKEDRNAMRLMTVHASKGLEFSYVFIVGLEEDLFPHSKPDSKRNGVEESEEERRLFYVALTRARKKLFLTHTAVRTIFGSPRINTPSQFLFDIDASLVENPPEERTERVVYLE